MKTLTSPLQFDCLPHDETITVALIRELLTPFDSTAGAESFWKETNTTLWALLPDESLADTNREAEILAQFDHVEYVIQLIDDWHLALVITADDGGGCYLLFSTSIDSALVQLATAHLLGAHDDN